MDKTIAIAIPVLNRPSQAQRIVDSITRATTVPHLITFVCTEGDDAEIEAVRATGQNFLTVPRYSTADFARKTNAVYRNASAPYIFTGADDLEFHPGWAEAALAKMTDGIGVVGTNDLGNPKVMTGEHSTHSLVARWYADNHGTIDGPGAIFVHHYPHEFVDDEFIGTAKSRGMFAMAMDSHVEHLHPHWDKRDHDHLTKLAPRRLQQGRRIFRQRTHLWRPEEVKTVPISVIVGTFGADSWKELALTRAIPSVSRQAFAKPVEVIHIHGDNLADARNEGARQASAPNLLFLDADDELDSKYIASMGRVLSTGRQLFCPSIQFILPEGPKPPKMFNTRDLSKGNYLPIGCVARADKFWEAGGFDSKHRAWEDYYLWRKMVDGLGCRIARVPRAIYIAHWNAQGRNNTIDNSEQLKEEIDADYERWLAERNARVG